MSRPIIGVTSGAVINEQRKWAPAVQGQSHTYTDALIRADAVPIILPLTDDFSVYKALVDCLDGLMLCGGNDINPNLYGEEPYPTTIDYSDLRDRAELYLLEETINQKKPVLGICRGMQILNIYYGGSLYQHIPSDLPQALNHEKSTEAKELEHVAHPLKIVAGSKLHKLLGLNQVSSNTHHHQAIKALGHNLKVVASSSDGVIEAVENPDYKFMLGLQAHPESLESQTVKDWQKVFRGFVDSTRT